MPPTILFQTRAYTHIIGNLVQTLPRQMVPSITSTKKPNGIEINSVDSMKG